MNRIFIVFTLLIFSAVALAQDDFTVDPTTSKAIPNFAGEVMIVKGKAFYKLGKTGEEKAIKKGTRVKKDYYIRTEKGSFVRIKLVDDTLVNLAGDSNILIENWIYKDKDDRQMILNFLKGKLRANVKRKAQPGDIEIKTPTTSMGIRGTIVLANVNKDEDNKVVTELALLTGKAQITNRNTGKKYNLKPADHYIQFTDRSNNQLAEGMKRFDKATFENLLARDASADEELPFMEYFQGNIEGSRGPSSVTAPGDPESGGESDSAKEEGSSNWRDNLNQLNERLNEYNGY